MKNQDFANSVKNAVGTVFLLAGAFFVCSTMLSIRSVFADPIAPVDATMYSNQNARNTNARSGRASPRGNTATSRATVARTAVPGGSVTRNANPRGMTQNRAVTSRANVNRAGGATQRNIVSRQTAAMSRANANNTRAVRARTATTDAINNSRVSLQGNAIRGSKASTNQTTAYNYLTNKLYTGNYSNIIDTTTGLISADAFNNCMESYYTCMDEICTARNVAQRRCACAGRVKAFAEAETALETANEELIKVSGELALLIANKGKDVSEAFQLTDAEKVMNCVSWQDTTNQYGSESDQAKEWCSNHGIYENGAQVSECTKPDYCSSTGNGFGFDVTNLDGSSSNILASLQAWAKAKEQTITILDNNEDDLLASFDSLSSAVSGLGGFAGAWESPDELKDSLAETWGYELFEYAHNNVCARVLDSCFNGIYEACGTPPSGTKCSNGAGQCPYNYNSVISVSKDGGEYNLDFITANTNYTASNTAACFGYTSTSGDPYSNLRKPVADARRSIMQKYALDANADCDAYGEQLRATAQNIGYQKVAAQQALQQKRLEFANEERETILADAVRASTNFDSCISELYECYEAQLNTHGPGKNSVWTASRIRTYCAQVANVPSCYEEMICNPSRAAFKAIIDKADSATCLNTQDYTTNTCRNIVTLNEILNGTGATSTKINTIKTAVEDGTLYVDQSGSDAKQDSAALREYCLQEAIGVGDGGKLEIRVWLENQWNDMAAAQSDADK